MRTGLYEASINTIYPIDQAPDPTRVARDEANQRVFGDIISGARHGSMHRLPDLSQQLNRQGRPTDGIYESLHSPGEDKLYFEPDVFGENASAGYFPDRTEFQSHPTLRLGRENSRQQVFFGDLRSSWFNKLDDQAMNVAIKSITRSSGDARSTRVLHEVAMYQELAKAGLRTLGVKGVILLGEPREGVEGFVVTETQPDLTTADTFGWTEMSYGERLDKVNLAVNTLAELHSKLFFHGDAEFKNIAFGERSGQVRVVDVEWGSSLQELDEEKLALRARQLMSADLTNVGTSIDEYVLMRTKPMDAMRRFEVFYHSLLAPYFERLQALGGSNLNVLDQAYREVVELKYQFAKEFS